MRYTDRRILYFTLLKNQLRKVLIYKYTYTDITILYSAKCMDAVVTYGMYRMVVFD